VQSLSDTVRVSPQNSYRQFPAYPQGVQQHSQIAAKGQQILRQH